MLGSRYISLSICGNSGMNTEFEETRHGQYLQTYSLISDKEGLNFATKFSPLFLPTPWESMTNQGKTPPLHIRNEWLSLGQSSFYLGGNGKTSPPEVLWRFPDQVHAYIELDEIECCPMIRSSTTGSIGRVLTFSISPLGLQILVIIKRRRRTSGMLSTLKDPRN